MARVETIVVGGGIGAGSPFELNFVPIVGSTDPPLLITTDFMSTVPTGANRGLVISTTGDPLASTNRLRVKGGIVSEHANYASSVVLGQTHTVTGSFANGFVLLGRGLTLDSGAGGNPVENILVGANITISGTASGVNANVAVGSAISSIGSSRSGNIIIGIGITETTTTGPRVAIGVGITYTGGSANVVIGGGASITTSSSSNCVVIGENAAASATRCTVIGDSASATVLDTTVVGRGSTSVAQSSVILGAGSSIGNVAHTNNILIGTSLNSFQANTCIIGTAGFSQTITTLLVGGNNIVNANGSNLLFRMINTTGTDRIGGSLTINSGLGTGAGATSNVIVQTPTAGVAGSVAQLAATRLTIGSTAVTFDATVQAIHEQDRGVRLNNQTSAAGAAAGTLLNSPTAGDPVFWLKISIGGVNHAIPCWLG